MKWLSIEFIKKHSRIDFDCEDDLLELYGDSAEETIMDITRRSYEELKKMKHRKNAVFGKQRKKQEISSCRCRNLPFCMNITKNTAISPIISHVR